MKQTDYLVIGAGIAGLTTAYLLSEFGSVLVITKGKLKQANTYWAQGGIAAVLEKEDSFESHIKDTIEAGAQHCDPSAVRYLVENAPKAIRFLKGIGVSFQDKPVLEGCHSRPRVWRTSDFTGQDILNQLIKSVKKEKNITIKENANAARLIIDKGECKGVFVLNEKTTKTESIFAKYTVLATGGCGQLFGKTTNTLGSGGDGLALALNAGIELKDMEFIQFHPTALNIPDNGRYFLLSEVLRGFGAHIINSNDERFLLKFDKRGELAPRDLISRAVYFEMMNDPVYLDMRHLDANEIKKTFPNIYRRLKEYRFDLTKDRVPITPVAHYACGGIPVDLKGATQIPNLFAIGEVARTGVHGANRLASNSLLEAVVFARATAEVIKKSTPIDKNELIVPDIETPTLVTEDIAQAKAYSKRIGQIMWENVGIIRTPDSLYKAEKEINTIPARDYRIQNRQLVCSKIIEACIARSKSLGTHYITEELS